MPTFGTDNYRSAEEYHFASETFARLSGCLLFEFARQSPSTRNQITRFAIARVITTLRSVNTLWQIKAFSDCWTMHRSLLDRYFHLVELGRTNSHEIFDNWSFMKQYEANSRIQSDERYRPASKSSHFTPTPEQKARYHALAKAKPTWRRPKAEDVAKTIGLDFLYHYSYDFASSHVHPMSNDGQEDFYTITKLEPIPEFPTHIPVLHNSLLVACLIVNEAMRQSDLLWRGIVPTFFDQLMLHLENGSEEYKNTFVSIIRLGPEYRLSGQKPQDNGQGG